MVVIDNMAHALIVRRQDTLLQGQAVEERRQKGEKEERKIPKSTKKDFKSMFGSETDWIRNHKSDNGEKRINNNLLRDCPKLVSYSFHNFHHVKRGGRDT